MTNSPWKAPKVTKRQVRAAELKHFLHESGGLMRALLIDQDDQDQIMKAAIAGSELARTIIVVISDAIRQMTERRAPKRLCLFCDNKFTRELAPSAFVLFLPRSSDEYVPYAVVATAICSDCRAERTAQEIIAQAAKKFQPDGEVLIERGASHGS